MSIVTLAQAKLHLRVDGNDEDALIQVYLDASERSIANYLNRNFYADAAALSSAISAARSALESAKEDYADALVEIESIDDATEAAIESNVALAKYTDAQDETKRAMKGIVINDAIRGAVLLQVGHLYANRESVSQQPGNYMLELPLGLKWLVDPYRIEMGV